MVIPGTKKSLVVAGVFIGTMIIFGLGAYLGKVVSTRNQNSNLFLIEGFDFDRIRTADIEWRGPAVGTQIDLARLKGEDGKSLKELVNKKPVMLVSTHPDCGMCRIATDEMYHLRNELLTKDIKYYIVYFPQESPQIDFFKYSASLNIGAPGFLWDSQAGPPLPEIVLMNSPSHLLVNGDGTIIRVWPGAYNDKLVRERMARQILADTFVVLDTLNALEPKAVSKR